MRLERACPKNIRAEILCCLVYFPRKKEQCSLEQSAVAVCEINWGKVERSSSN